MATLVSGAMDLLHDQSLGTISMLQASFPNSYLFMINISTILDPKYVFLIYAPLLFALNKRVGHRMLIALTWAEWANQVLKWLLAGERPYWYVHERANELAQMRNQTLFEASEANIALDNIAPMSQVEALTGRLRQFPVTCELGAGSPSGHAMVTATVWYILIDAVLKGELQPFKRASRQLSGQSNNNNDEMSLVAKACWSCYALMLLAVSLSRVYLACHFPHQCLAGAALGCLMARYVATKLQMDSLNRRHFVLSTAWMFASAMLTYGALRLTGFDPLWSVGKGMRWCVKSEYIHLDTTPFFSMMRYLGFCLGAGLAFDGAKLAKNSRPQASGSGGSSNLELIVRRVVVVALALLAAQLLQALPLPRNNMQLFYAASFLAYTLFAYAIAGPIPQLVKQLSGRISSSTSQHLKQN